MSLLQIPSPLQKTELLKNFRALRGQCCRTVSLVVRDAEPWDKHAGIKKHASTHALTLLSVETFANAELH